jgi:hypothetical protein
MSSPLTLSFNLRISARSCIVAVLTCLAMMVFRPSGILFQALPLAMSQ